MTDHHMEQTELNGGVPRQWTPAGVGAGCPYQFLEVIQASDRPFEVFEEEDTSKSRCRAGWSRR